MIRLPWWVASLVLLLIAVAAFIFPLGALKAASPALGPWANPQAATAVGFGIGLIGAAVWSAYRGLSATGSVSGSISSPAVKVSYTLNDTDWYVMAGSLAVGLIGGLIVGFIIG